MEESQMDFYADYLGETSDDEPEPDFSDDYYVDKALYAEFDEKETEGYLWGYQTNQLVSENLTKCQKTLQQVYTERSYRKMEKILKDLTKRRLIEIMIILCENKKNTDRIKSIMLNELEQA